MDDDDLLLQVLKEEYKSDLVIRPKRVWTLQRDPPKEAHKRVPLESPVSFVYSSFNTCSPGGRQREYVSRLGPRPRTTQVLDVLKSLQSTDYKKFHHNIRYNFMIGGDGVVYRGRGWTVSPSLPRRHLFNTNHSVYIGFIGYWHDEPPDDSLFELRNELIRIGVSKGVIHKKFLHVTLAYPSVYSLNFESYIK